ncbi:alpha/beta hydrolase [Ferruginibacter yonginensis]|uniref:Alpha/beta hydrolase n=1 Tax=Ferruginibacter yonginensis TaxID=1310416 RepID=A0ABV8QSS5_9BACT
MMLNNKKFSWVSVIKSIAKTAAVLFLLLNIITLFHAYKFTHYYEAGEVNIKPNNEKTGWDKTKELLFGFTAAKQPNLPPDSSYKIINLYTKDSLRLEAWYKVVPQAKGTVALFHGHGGNKAKNVLEATAFQQMGYNTLLLDFRAHGNSQGNTCTIGFYEAEDVALAYEYLQKSGEKNIVLWGISLGAATITKAINDYQLQPQRVILEMPFASLPDAVTGRLKIMHVPTQPIGTLLTFWGGTIHGFWAFGLQPYRYAAAIQCPVLLQHGTNDPRVTVAETQQIFDQITTAKKWVEYQNSAHESLCKNEHDKWIAEVSAFLK